MVLDDFGKGYSSFGYLSRAHFSKIKIDQSFVRAAAAGERESVAIVNAILALARGLGVETTAEGVETEAQAERHARPRLRPAPGLSTSAARSRSRRCARARRRIGAAKAPDFVRRARPFHQPDEPL